MILLADSGSTKCDWLLLSQEGKRIATHKTMGFNPFFHSSTRIEGEIKSHPELIRVAEQVKAIYYFGSGCSLEGHKAVVREALHFVFPRASVQVDHDMKAAAYAAYEGEPCITCILGTGSNAAWFDGQKLVSKNAGLGYILGDEASGTYFGKKLLAAYLYKLLPEDIASDLENEYKVNRAVIFQHVYEKPHANIYLAGFTPFLAKHKGLPLFDAMLYDGMKTFLQIHVCSFENHRAVKSHFVGSIAWHFRSSLQRAANDLEIPLGQIIGTPIEKLLEYHQRYVFPSNSK